MAVRRPIPLAAAHYAGPGRGMIGAVGGALMFLEEAVASADDPITVPVQ